MAMIVIVMIILIVIMGYCIIINTIIIRSNHKQSFVLKGSYMDILVMPFHIP
jgi:hypothetical protein